MGHIYVYINFMVRTFYMVTKANIEQVFILVSLFSHL